jgi:high-affinity iron transporter
MQLAHWIASTPIKPLVNVIPAWMGVWFSVFPTVETMVAQAIAAALVLGFYFAPRFRTPKPDQNDELTASTPAEEPTAVL